MSPDGRYLAYGADFTGYREYTVHVKDLSTGRLLPDRLERVDSLAWAADNATIFYTQQNAAKRPDRVFRHVLGGKDDALVWEEKDELFNLGVGATRSDAGAYHEAERSCCGTDDSRHAVAVRDQPARLVKGPRRAA